MFVSVRHQRETLPNIYPAILRVCRKLHREGIDMVAENQIIAVNIGREISADDIAAFNLHCREHEHACKASASPVLTFFLHDDRPKSRRRHYIFELRDVFYLIRYLLYYARSDLIIGGMDVRIHRTEIRGLCETETAGRQLFWDLIYPHLDGEILPEGSGMGLYLPVRLSPIWRIKYPRCLSAGDRVTRDIVEQISTLDSRPNLQRWDGRPALALWGQRLGQLYDFASTGIWSQGEGWEPFAH